MTTHLHDMKRIRTHLIWGVLLFSLAWSVLVALVLGWNIHQEQDRTRALTINAARANFNKDLAFRLWATSHGGVYVPTNARTPPNPNLAHIPERDIVTPSGRHLTLMNPAYMVRQLMEEFPGIYGVRGRITSLKPLNPANAPDDWEVTALKAFEQGVEEVMEFTRIEGESALRLMRPMITQKGCLKCHEHQCYVEGDVRGGVGVTVFMKEYMALEREAIRLMIWTHVGFWLPGLGVIGIMHFLSWRRWQERFRWEASLQEANVALEERVRERTSELVAANQELESFTSAVSHDLRAPLRGIDGSCHILLEDYGEALDQEARKHLQDLVNSSREMNGLIDGLLTLSRTTRGELEREPVDLTALAREILLELESQEPHRQVAQRVKPGLTAFADLRFIKVVLTNLLGNAWKYTARTEAPHIVFDAENHQGETVFRVSDNGAGFDMAYADKLFKPFQRLHGSREFPGNGIGLATVQRIVHRHGGRIWAEAQVDRGATFFFTLAPREKTP